MMSGCRGGHSGILHERLREPLRCLDLRGTGGGTEYRAAALPERIDDARRNRSLRSHECQVDVRALDEPKQPTDVVGFHRNALAELRNSCVSGSADELQ